MTYVTEQTSEELRAHMRRLQAMPGWHNPLDDRLWKEVQTLEAERDQLLAEVERLRKPLTPDELALGSLLHAQRFAAHASPLVMP